MTTPADPYRERLRQAMDRMTALRDALAEERARQRGPVAIVGLGCRLPPQVSDPEAFFDDLLAGVDATSPAPSDRWPEAAAGLPRGGYLAEVRGFDAAFFGISPREAAAMDPQQRLLLEVVWEALERAGLAPERLPGERVGVFLGIAGGDYLARVLAGAPEMYALTGNGGAFASGRLAYSLGFRGPCLAVDTACSSALVALHLAVQSLRRGECDVAVVAGVNLILEPDTTKLLQAGGALAPDGRCKSFDAAADGFARAEGAVALVLTRLPDARRGDAPVLAVIRGSAINQDGRSTGLTAPNVEAQRAMLVAALADADVDPGSVGYVETHGTGTSLGDPIEFDALRAVFGRRRGDLACVLGAVKTNVGHLEAAAGLVGVLKAIGCLRRGVVPANLHFTRPNPHLTLAGTPFVLPIVVTPFPANGPRRAGVSAFGMSGTNAHVVLEQAPLDDASDASETSGTNRDATRDATRGTTRGTASDTTSGATSDTTSDATRGTTSDATRGTTSDTTSAATSDTTSAATSTLLTLSARDPGALAALASATADALAAGLDLRAAARTSAIHRSHHRHRLAVVVAPGDDPTAILRAFARGDAAPGLELGDANHRDAPVFVCAGQGSAWPGMGRALRAVPAARAVLAACAATVREHTGHDLLAAMDDDHALARTELAQPAIVAVTLALAAALAVHGVRPAAVIGHSVGELAAAQLAGALGLADALRLACVRGRVMQATAGQGAMVAVTLDPAATARAIADVPNLEIAALNGPRATVVAGAPAAVDALIDRLAASGVRCRRLTVDHAFHTAQMDPILPAFTAAAGRVSPSAARCTLYSTVTGRPLAGPELGVDHWRAGIRDPVRLADALQAAASDGHRLFLELGPHPILGGATGLADTRVITTLRRDRAADAALLQTLAALHVEGAPVDLAPLHAGRGPVAALPTYPWQRREHWISRTVSPSPDPPASAPITDEPPVDALARHAVERRVHAEIAAVLQLPSDAPIPARRGLFDLGFDSLLSVELARRLARAFARPLAPTVVFDHPTLAGLVDHLCALAEQGPSLAPRRPTREPIAIIGMACRFPGGALDPEALWALLRDARTGIVEVPPDRWDRDAHFDPDPAAAGKMYATRAGFLQGVDLRAFDAECFNISPAEAASLDPQQRLLLELTWEALDDAGRPHDRLEGTRTGVYVGIATSDYGQQLARRPLAELEGFFATGCAMNTAAGRIAYVLGTRGPTLAVDTACSSSLVALHLASESLRRGETDLAIVAGTNLMLDPAIGVLYSRLGALAPDGRCKPFDAGADGMVRGEGAAVVVLARERDARAARDRVHALVLGSAVGHDGRSSGLTVPSGPAQQAVVREALADAGVAPADVDFVETHGTGTALGDPIEANALVAALAPGRGPERPLILGSVKANLGHLEPAAGLAGLIKVVQAMRHRTIPAQPGFVRLNSAITPGEVVLVVPTTPLPWTGRRIAGLSSFGVSGTNAHVVLAPGDETSDATSDTRATSDATSDTRAMSDATSDATSDARATNDTRAMSDATSDTRASDERRATSDERDAPIAIVAIADPDELDPAAPALLLPISARRADALPTLVAAWRERLADRSVAVADLCAAATLRRARLPHRLAIVGSDRAGLLAGLAAWARGELGHPGVAVGEVRGPRRLAFVFSGHGGHWLGMGRRLLADPVFAAAVRRCDLALARVAPGTSLLADLQDPDIEPRWRSKWVVQRTILGLQIALAVVLRAWGVVPAVMLGHSSGELAAAVAAGALSLTDAFRLCLARTTLFDRLPAGAMAVVGCGPEAVAEPLAAWAGRATIAVHNAPQQVVVSGDVEAIAGLGRHFAAHNVFFRPVAGADAAGHSHHLDPFLPEFAAAVADLAPAPTTVPFYSSVTAGPLAGPALDVAHWTANLRQRVRFADAVAQLQRDGIDAFLEIGPHPLLASAIAQVAPDAAVVATLERGADDRLALRGALARLHVAGVDLDDARIAPAGSPALALPRHPWHRQTHWLSPSRGAVAAGRHPLIHSELRVARTGEAITEAHLDCGRPDLPAPLTIQGVRVLAPALLLEFVRVALADRGAPTGLELGPALPFDRRVDLQLARDGDRFELFARVDDGDWQAQGRGRVAVATPPPTASLAELRARCTVADDRHRERERARGLQLPPALDLVDQVWLGEREALARLRPSGGTWSAAAAHSSGLQLLASLVHPPDAAPVAGELFWPRRIEAVLAPSEPPAWLHVALRGPAGDLQGGSGDVTCYADDGRPLACLRGVELGPPERSLARRVVATQLARWTMELAWEPAPARPTDREPGSWVVLTDPHGDAAAATLTAELARRGHATRVSRGDDPAAIREQLRRARQTAPLRGVIDLRGLADRHMSQGTDENDLSAGTDPAARSEAAVLALIELTRIVVAEAVPRLVIVTAGGQAVLPGEAPDLAAAAWWGVGRTLPLEHPELQVRLCDLDPAAPDLAAAADEALAQDAEDQVAWRGEARLGARLVPAGVPVPAAPLRCDPSGTWLITGGLGGVGLQLARWLVDRGARHLLLVGRHGLPDVPATDLDRERAATVAALRADGVRVDIAAIDVADEPAVRACLAALPADRPLRGVFHAAGVTRFEPLVEATPEAVRAVLRAKVAGACVLDRLCRGRELVAFVCFSSASATWGAAGMALYGAANHFLDLLAHHRRAAGLPALTIAWGGWSGGGMTGAATRTFAAQMGLLAAPAQQQLEAMDACMQAGATQRTVAAVDWSLFKPLLEARGERALLRRIVVAPAIAGDGPLARTLAAAAAPERWPTLLAAVADRVAAVLGVGDPAALDLRRGFFQMGMDSMMTVRLRRALEQDTGAALPPTLALEQPSVLALARWLARSVFDLEAPAEAPVEAPAELPITDDDDLGDRSEAELLALLAAELEGA